MTKEKASCQMCPLTHPILLHIKKWAMVADPKKTDDREGQKVLSAVVCAEGCELIGAGEDNCTIVAVQVKAKKGNVVVQAYAFFDPGSSAMFCTEALMNKLKISGRKTYCRGP